LIVTDVPTTKDDETGLDLLFVGDEFHFACPAVQNLCRLPSGAVGLPWLCRFCVGSYTKYYCFFLRVYYDPFTRSTGCPKGLRT
jgi:hypothetical protein